ncbi:hypothetical protein [Arachidicoccus terrestris]|uniref:hypothetical protein n=1 Tax=Arachidicoccus terrestris TaxID=2875539 RepID=UPI001CC6AF89|nr:hypothetical protein [Arachidicoccus terrestris]UAY54286.1 hypothetical protein K9M52_12570 [Arachidicoccus terrestris]
MLKKDNVKLGILIGLLAPSIGILGYYLVKFFPVFSFKEYARAVFHNKSILTAVSSISLMANVIIFTYYINRKIDQTAKGIFLITCIYILAVLVYKIV